MRRNLARSDGRVCPDCRLQPPDFPDGVRDTVVHHSRGDHVGLALDEVVGVSHRDAYAILEAIPGVHCPRPTGAFYVFPDVSAHYGKQTPAGCRISDSVSFATALLEDVGVAVVPGADFGACASGHVRLSFACSPEQITEGCRRIREWLQSLG